jgi:DNA-binding GntR family transcriptional regulator
MDDARMNDSRLETLSESAYQAIRERTLRGVFPIGSSLSRRKLAGLLEMSQLPVSEALQRLESDGLVETKARAFGPVDEA